MSAVNNQGKIARLLEMSRRPLFCLLSSQDIGSSASTASSTFTPANVIGVVPVKKQYLAYKSTALNGITSGNPQVLNGNTYYAVNPALSDNLIISSGLGYDNFRIITSVELSTDTISIADNSSVTIKFIGLISNLKTQTSADIKGFFSNSIITSSSTSYIVELTRVATTPIVINSSSTNVITSNFMFNI